MDGESFWVWGLLGIILIIGWVWTKRRGVSVDHDRPDASNLQKQILRWLGIADLEELSVLRQQLETQRLEIATRLDRLDLALTHQGQVENLASEVNGRLSQLEAAKASLQAAEQSKRGFSKTILCLGVRVTLMEQIWSELGIVNARDVQDSQIHKWIQGPFCRNCLRSLVVQGEKSHEKFVRSQCRYCSLPWREASASPISLVFIKREVYEYLDIACRRSRERG